MSCNRFSKFLEAVFCLAVIRWNNWASEAGQEDAIGEHQGSMVSLLLMLKSCS
jgi:hypothetical protein